MQSTQNLFQELDLNDREATYQPASRMSRIKIGLQSSKDTQDRENISTFDLKNCPLQQNLDLECQKLRESYGAHRRQRTSKSRGKSGGKAQHSISPSRSNSFAPPELKENNNYNSLNITPVAANRFKRTQNQEANNSYSTKYQKLEENFKKFTKSLQEKRNSCSKSPVRNKTLHVSEQYQSRVLVVAPARQATKDEPITDRKLAMKIMLSQVQNFLVSSFEKLHQLSVSKTQEQDLRQIQDEIFFSLDSINDDPDEVKKLQETLEQILDRIRTMFSQITSRVYQIESNTFINYKFKNVINLMQHLIEESYRMQVTELMPQLLRTIQTHKIQAGLQILAAVQKEQSKGVLGKAVLMWKRTTFRGRKLAALSKKIHHQKEIRKMARAFWLWCSDKQGKPQQANFILKLLLDAQLFQTCIESEAGLNMLLCKSLKSEALDCDIIFITESGATVVDQETGNMSQFSLESIKGSITAECYERADEIKLIPSVFASRQFKDNIDRPFLSQTILKSFKFELGMTVIPLMLDGPVKKVIALLRVFNTQSKLRNSESKGLLHVGSQVSHFISRVQGLRMTIEYLTEQLAQQNDQLKLAELEQSVHKCLFDILNDLHNGTKADFLELMRLRTQMLLNKLVPEGDEQFFIREILYKKEDDSNGNMVRILETGLLADPTRKQTLIRKRDHQKEGSDLLMDYLDYQSDNLVQQVSLDVPSFTMILHRSLAFETKRENTLSNTFKHALRLLVKCLEPILLQGLKIHEDLAGKVKKQSNLLFRQVQVDKAKAICRSKLYKLASQQDDQLGYAKIFEALVECFSLIDDFEIKEVSLMVNTACFTGHEPEKLFGYLTDSQIQLMQVPETFTDKQIGQVSRIEVLASDFKCVNQEFSVIGDLITVKLPIISQNCLLGLIKIYLCAEGNKNDFSDLKFFLSNFVEELASTLQGTLEEAKQHAHFTECFNQLRHQVQSLTLDIDFMQAVQQYLVIPFTRSPSLKTIGFSLTELALRVLPQEVQIQAIQLVKDGRILSEDIRSQVFGDFGSAVRMPGFVEMNEKMMSIRFDSGKQSCLVLKMLFEGIKNELAQQCEVFQLIIASFVKTALSSLTNAYLPASQEHLPRTVAKIATQRKYGYIYSFFSSLKEMKVNCVPIFTRLNSFKHILKTKPVATKDYVENSQKAFEEKKHVLQIYAQSFKRLNEFAVRAKQASFDRFKFNVLRILHDEQETLKYMTKYQPTKRQRKSVCMIQRIKSHLNLRAYFCKLAILSQQFRNLNNPQNKLLGAVLCFNYNFVRMRKRIAIQKLRCNASDRIYRDFSGFKFKDREFMLDLQKQLLTDSQPLSVVQEGADLESQFTFALEQAMTYLQQSFLPESVDVIVVNVQQSGGKKARGYVFNSKINSNDDVLRLGVKDVLDQVTSENVGLMSESLEGLRDFTITFAQDVVLQMMSKSQTMFNFKDINTSLYQLYLKSFGKDISEVDAAQRMILIHKSQSALLCPLTVRTHEDTLVGSLELFRFNSQPFDPEFEARMRVFVEHFSNVLQVYLSIRHTRTQQQLVQTCRAPTSLTSLLRHLQHVTPQILNVPHVLCLILNEELAYFYQFKDNYIYNFKFSGTFIEEVIDYQCVLELTCTQRQSPKSRETLEFDTFNQDQLTHKKHAVTSLKSVTNLSGFKHIFYYPVVADSNVVAIMEIGYTQDDQVPKVVMNEAITALSIQFASQLSQLTLRLKAFCRQTKGILAKRETRSKAKAFLEWKSSTQIEIQKVEFQQNQKQLVQQTEECFQEYVKSLESYDCELKKLVEEKQGLLQEQAGLKRDRVTKYKLLGASLFLLQMLEKKQRRQTHVLAFNKWRHYSSIAKIAESAFNKMLELNYRHCDKRFEVAAYLLKKSCLKQSKRAAFENILSFARMTMLKTGVVASDYSSYKLGMTQNSALNMSGRTGIENFSNIVGPFQKSQIQKSLTKSSGPTMFNSICQTPTIANLNLGKGIEQLSGGYEAPHLQMLHQQLGFGCVPKGLSKRENGSAGKSKTRSSKSAERRQLPIVKKMNIN